MTDAVDPKPAAIAEAAIWLARLRSDERPGDVAQRFRAWLESDEANPAAFEAVSDAWELSGGTRLRPSQPEKARARHWRVPAMAACAALVAFLAIWQVDSASGIATEVGERRSLRLADGSVVTLNTDTEIHLDFSDDKRAVRLDRGEASFDVAKDGSRPFVVEAGAASVTAVGTEFDVRWLDGDLAVTLAEGSVRVVGDDSGGGGGVLLRPGQTLSDRAGSPPRVRPVNLRVARAWRSGQLVFDDTPLVEAISEMNRYSTSRISLADNVAGLRISGAFDTGGSAEFARALGDLYGLRVAEVEDDYVLAPAADTRGN